MVRINLIRTKWELKVHMAELVKWLAPYLNRAECHRFDWGLIYLVNLPLNHAVQFGFLGPIFLNWFKPGSSLTYEPSQG